MNNAFEIRTIIAAAIGVILASGFYFPIGVPFIGGNSKMDMAAAALAIIMYQGATSHKDIFSRDIIMVVISALTVSLTCFLSIVWNGTSDTTYATYAVSMIVWLAGAYAFVSYLKFAGFKINVGTIALFMLALGFTQCVLALLISRYPAVEDFFIRIHLLTEGDVAYAHRMDRLFGIGCAYDPAGIRLGGILILAGVYFNDFVNKHKERPVLIFAYLAAFFLITVVGSMISRTTSIGALMALAYYGLRACFGKDESRVSMKYLAWGLAIGIAVISFLYVKDDRFKKDFRFGFEGFVSMVEKGSWEVESNDMLMDMYVFPDNMHTWLIGDGYIDSTDLDKYYIGKRYKGYYMGTDVGYLRFIYYGGLIFLAAFVAFFCLTAKVCGNFFPRYRGFFFLLLAFQLAVWLKVATDIFCLFAIFLAAGMILQGANQSDDGTILENVD